MWGDTDLSTTVPGQGLTRNVVSPQSRPLTMVASGPGSEQDLQIAARLCGVREGERGWRAVFLLLWAIMERTAGASV